jgi:hypothetical protein
MLTAYQVVRILEVQYGHFQSSRRWSAIDGLGQPIPWFTYPATEYLTQFDLSDKTVFEYGAGNSTLFWSARARRVVSVEDNEAWYQKLCGRIGTNVEITLASEKSDYIGHIAEVGNCFDIITIDGNYRDQCAQVAVKYLRPGGLIILDNADWWLNTAQFLREANLIQVDMSGFTPINGYTSTTSLFLHRDFRFTTQHQHQPYLSVGGLKHRAPEEALAAGVGG